MTFKFGDPVTNTVAGDKNPTKHGTFVRYVRKTGKLNPGTWAECTDGKGDFWLSNPETLVPSKGEIRE